MIRVQPFDWTEARIDELLEMWRTGFTTYQMAAHFKVSRNTICGKLHREKIKRGILEKKPVVHRPCAAYKKKFQPKKAAVRKAAAVVPPAPVEPTPDNPRWASIMDVTGCRWAVKDDPSYVGGFAFCNEATDGGSYCAQHAHESVASWSARLIKKTISDAVFVYRRRAA